MDSRNLRDLTDQEEFRARKRANLFHRDRSVVFFPSEPVDRLRNGKRSVSALKLSTIVSSGWIMDVHTLKFTPNPEIALYFHGFDQERNYSKCAGAHFATLHICQIF